MADRLPFFERLHFLHRAWRYRLRSEREELAFMRRCGLAGKTAIDIGAHRGIYSYWMHRAVGRAGRVIAFEPQPEMQEQLAAAKNSFDLHCLEIVCKGLSSSPGVMRLVRDPQHTGGAHLDTGTRPLAAVGQHEAIQVSITTLDEHFDQYDGPPVAFIKCDVEGHEVAAFEGGRELLRRDHPTLLVEIHDRHVREGTLFNLLAEWGYEASFPHRGRLVPMAEYEAVRPSIGKAYLNYVFQARPPGSVPAH